MGDEHDYKIGELTSSVRSLQNEVGLVRSDIAQLFSILTNERVKAAKTQTRVASIVGAIGIFAGGIGSFFMEALLKR